MWRIEMKWGVATFVALATMLCLTTLGWGAETVSVSLVDLGDRDAVILRVDGEALVSELVVHKLRPSRLEAFYRFDGEAPASVNVSGDLISGVDLSERPDGFLLTLALSSSIPASGETIYRETVLGSGQTALEVFSNSSKRGPFQVSWADQNVTPKADASPISMSRPGSEPSTRVDGFTGAAFDAGTMQLTLRGAAGQSYEVVNKTFPPRVDVMLRGSSLTPEVSGKVYKNLNGQVTFVEVVKAKASEGIVVRANLTSGIGLVNQVTQGSDLVLTFGNVAKQAPAPSFVPKPQVPQPAPALSQSKVIPVSSTPVQPLGTSVTAGSVGSSLSGLASSAMNAPTPMGFRGVPQDIPSVEQILSKSREDAKRYSSDVAKRTDKYGSYDLPSFPGADEQLSDVRVNLNAAGGFGLRSFLTFLSQLSGISIIIDPYWVDTPFGTTIRQPPDPGTLPGGGGGPGFRDAGIFDPSFGGTGTIEGNFDNVPFDQALEIVLNTHNLKKVVYRDEDDPYAKPIILITSKERLEQELVGQNEVDLYQLHYADPFQIYNILRMLGLLPSLQYGWYQYQGGGGGNNGGGGGGGNNGGRGGGGQGGGGGGQGGGGGRRSATPLDTSFASGGEMASNYFGNSYGSANGIDPMQGGGLGGGGGGQGGGGGGQGGGGGGQGGGGQGGGGGGGGFGGQLWTAKAGLVVMRGTRGTLDEVQSLIAKIDKPPKQVAIKVKLYTTSNNPQEISGLINTTAQDDRVDLDYAGGALSFNILPKGGVLLDENYSAAFSYLQSESKARLVSETEVAVIDGFPASITTDRTRGQLDYQAQVNTGTGGGITYTPTWTPISAGSTLTFTPQIDDRGRVTMNVNIDISFFDGAAQRASAPDGGEVIFQPTGNTTINTYFRMVDGQAALLGGLTNSEDSESFQGIPYLSKLPFIGRFLGRTEKVKSSEHFFVVIQANIIDDK